MKEERARQERERYLSEHGDLWTANMPEQIQNHERFYPSLSQLQTRLYLIDH